MTDGLTDGLVMNNLICIMRIIEKKLNEERNGSGRNENEIEIAIGGEEEHQEQDIINVRTHRMGLMISTLKQIEEMKGKSQGKTRKVAKAFDGQWYPLPLC